MPVWACLKSGLTTVRGRSSTGWLKKDMWLFRQVTFSLFWPRPPWSTFCAWAAVKALTPCDAPFTPGWRRTNHRQEIAKPGQRGRAREFVLTNRQEGAHRAGEALEGRNRSCVFLRLIERLEEFRGYRSNLFSCLSEMFASSRSRHSTSVSSCSPAPTPSACSAK